MGSAAPMASVFHVAPMAFGEYLQLQKYVVDKYFVTLLTQKGHRQYKLVVGK